MFQGLVSQQSVLEKPAAAHWRGKEEEVERSTAVLSLAIEGLKMGVCVELEGSDVV